MRRMSAIVVIILGSLIINIDAGAIHIQKLRITNGSDVVLGEIPYMVSLRWFDSHYCGASILNEFYILTAAHCLFQNSPTVYSIQYGEIELNDNSNSIIGIEKIISYDTSLNKQDYTNDIAILKLSSPLVFNEYIKPVALPPPLYKTPAHAIALLSGWGSNETLAESMHHLQKAYLKVESDDDCELFYANSTFNSDRDHHLCAGDIEQGKAQCSGDSGGPLVIDGVQIGIVSYSYKPCGQVKPGVFTKVSAYVDWIKDIIGK